MTLRPLIACCAALLSACATNPTAGDRRTSVDLVVEGDYVLTMNGDEMIASGAVAISAGEIVAVGKAADIAKRYSSTQTISGEQTVVMPGLVNGHTHAAMSLLRGIADDLELMQWLQDYIFPAEVRFVDEEFVRIGTELACWEMIRGGTTTFVDLYYFPDAVAEAVERCGLRAIVAPTVIDQKSPDAENGAQSLAQAAEFARRWKDRNPRIIPAIAAHSVYTLPTEWVRKVRDAAFEIGVPTTIHLSESPFETQVIREQHDSTSTELLERLDFFDNPVIAAHVVWPSDSDKQKLAQHGVGVIHNPTSNMKLASGVSPVSSMLAAGVKVGLGTDGAASNNDLDMWEEIRLATFLAKVSEMDPTALPARRALSLATAEGAAAIGLGDQVGQLAPGMRADLIQVSLADLSFVPIYGVISHLAYVADEHDVTTVIVDGRILMRNREVLSINKYRLRREAGELTARIRAELVTGQDR
ncbi:MAG: amidohydrolase [Gammaproteobacteria bacterium]|nr:amidohydrolase [Gammaproteobacteria bacterium]NNF60432.1 amidohydrolase [Gammaproteobacteria bacterium]NNM20640.1 amidohydrolase [Gammaproteobacteria bacterium]